MTKHCAATCYTFGHEFAHLLGAGHDKDQGNNRDYDFGHGYKFKDGNNGFVTLLGYFDKNYTERVNFYSNPRWYVLQLCQYKKILYISVKNSMVTS